MPQFKKILSAIVFIFILAISLSQAKVHRIMLMGDSITDGVGSTSGLGYRKRLYWDLDALGFNFTFVGLKGLQPYLGHFKPGAVIRDFYHSSGDMYVKYELLVHRPSIITVHLGTNNILNDEYGTRPYVAPYSTDGGQSFSSSVSGELARLIALLADYHDGTEGDFVETVFVCQIIPKADGYFDDIINYNNAIATMVQDINNGQVPSIPPGLVRLVDQYSSFDVNTMFVWPPHVHPNDAGYKHMASVFVDSFRTLPWRITPNEGDQQYAFPGSLLPDSLTALVTNDYGRPAAGIRVEFDLLEGDAQILSPKSVVTDANGRASIEVKLEFSDTSKITAYAEGLVDSICTFNVMTTPLKLLAVGGNKQKTLPLKDFPSELKIKVEDVYSEPVANKPVVWEVVQGDGIVHSDISTTDASGVAVMICQAGWADSCIVEAGLADIPGETAQFTLYTKPLEFTMASGDSQQALPNSTLALPLEIMVADTSGNPQAGYSVTFATQTGDSRITTNPTVITDTNGKASAQCATGWADSSIVTATLVGSPYPDIDFHISLQQYVEASGEIRYQDNPSLPLSEVNVVWQTTTICTTFTNKDGIFEIDSIPRSQMFTLTPQPIHSDNFDPHSILAYDAALVARYVIGLDSLKKIQQVASDVNGDNMINILDAMGILRFVVGFKDTTNSRIGVWQYQPQSMTFDSLEHNDHSLHFNGTWIGDIHGGGYQNADVQNQIVLGASSIHKTTTSGDTISIPVRIKGIDILSCNVRLKYETDAAQFVDIKPVTENFSTASFEPIAGIVDVAAYTTEKIYGEVIPFEIKFLVDKENWRGPDIVLGIVNAQETNGLEITTSVENLILPDETQLFPCYPNPFNEQTVIPFSLKENGKVTVRIFNILGRQVRVVPFHEIPAGYHQIIWDGKNSKGQIVPTGIYLIELSADGYRKIQKIEKLR